MQTNGICQWIEEKPLLSFNTDVRARNPLTLNTSTLAQLMDVFCRIGQKIEDLFERILT